MPFSKTQKKKYIKEKQTSPSTIRIPVKYNSDGTYTINVYQNVGSPNPTLFRINYGNSVINFMTSLESKWSDKTIVTWKNPNNMTGVVVDKFIATKQFWIEPNKGPRVNLASSDYLKPNITGLVSQVFGSYNSIGFSPIFSKITGDLNTSYIVGGLSSQLNYKYGVLNLNNSSTNGWIELRNDLPTVFVTPSTFTGKKMIQQISPKLDNKIAGLSTPYFELDLITETNTNKVILTKCDIDNGRDSDCGVGAIMDTEDDDLTNPIPRTPYKITCDDTNTCDKLFKYNEADDHNTEFEYKQLLKIPINITLSDYSNPPNKFTYTVQPIYSNIVNATKYSMQFNNNKRTCKTILAANHSVVSPTDITTTVFDAAIVVYDYGNVLPYSDKPTNPTEVTCYLYLKKTNTQYDPVPTPKCIPPAPTPSTPVLYSCGNDGSCSESTDGNGTYYKNSCFIYCKK